MGRQVNDEFTHLNITHQRRWQLRQAKKGRCTLCAEKAVVNSDRCLKHNVQLALKNHERKYPNCEATNGRWLKLANRVRKVALKRLPAELAPT